MKLTKLALFLASLIIFSLLLKNVVKATVDRPVTVKISIEFAELRSGPGFEFQIVTKVRNGTILTICTQCDESQEEKDVNGKIWKQVFWDSEQGQIYGWILADYLNENRNHSGFNLVPLNAKQIVGIVYPQSDNCRTVQERVVSDILDKTGRFYANPFGESSYLWTDYKPLTYYLPEQNNKLTTWYFSFSTLTINKEDEKKLDNVLNSPKLMSYWAKQIGNACSEFGTVFFGVTGGNWQRWYRRSENYNYPHTRYDGHEEKEQEYYEHYNE